MRFSFERWQAFNCASDVPNVSFDDNWKEHLLTWLFGRLLRRLQSHQFVFKLPVHGADLKGNVRELDTVVG